MTQVIVFIGGTAGHRIATLSACLREIFLLAVADDAPENALPYGWLPLDIVGQNALFDDVHQRRSIVLREPACDFKHSGSLDKFDGSTVGV